jgi:5-methylcytosine-specific restriction protein A
LGREAFLKKYGYKYSRQYLLHYNESVYDFKAIAGVALGKQQGYPLKANEFSGGAATVVPVLVKLGFSVLKTPHPAAYLVIGKTYFRKSLVPTV